MIFSDFPFSINQLFGVASFSGTPQPTSTSTGMKFVRSHECCQRVPRAPTSTPGRCWAAWFTRPGERTKNYGSHGPNRNRWFTVLKNDGSFHGYVSHNQRVILFNIWVIYKVERLNYVTSSCLGWFRHVFPLPAEITGSSIPWDIQKLEVCLLVKITLLVLSRESMGMGEWDDYY